MKKEWKPEDLRQTSEEIRGATLAKSITPEMVGGTLSGLTEALAEVVDVLGEIPREHVSVKVRGYDGTGGVSGAGATVWLDVFHTKGYPVVSLPRQELTCGENGTVEFDIPHGFRYAVFSQIAGLGASFQLVKVAATDKREINLWNLPIGIKQLFCSIVYNNVNGTYRVFPVVADHYITDYESASAQKSFSWDLDKSPEKDESWEDIYYIGILVSTADTCFVIGNDSKSEEKKAWSSNRDYGTLIPGMPAINDHTEAGLYAGDLAEARARASADMDGNMNTAKILDSATNPVAANFCADYVSDNKGLRWLPSAGQAYLMYLNRTAINKLMQEAIDIDTENYSFVLLPDLKPGSSLWTTYEVWWTSTEYDCYCSWLVNSSGNIRNGRRYYSNDVRAVSAFEFEY
jgi:hypothetical protein